MEFMVEGRRWACPPRQGFIARPRAPTGAAWIPFLLAAALAVGYADQPENTPPGPCHPTTTDAAATPSISKLPLHFVENCGQWGTETKFVARKGSLVACFESDAIKVHLDDSPWGSSPVTLTFEGSSKGSTLAGEGRRSGYFNFFFGNDPAKWYSQVAAYAGVVYRGLYEGVDVRVREGGGGSSTT